ncbi:MAG TPA: DMT family transporter [Rhizobiales bacterium]|nr:DMT family transporter [Hyphomicrobiales bacterium]
MSANKAPGLSFGVAMMALLAGAMGMAISPVFVRLAEVGPFASAFWRVLLALPVLWLWAAIETKRAGQPHAVMWKLTPVLFLCGLFFAGDLFFWHLAILNTTIANATFLATMAPVWVVLGSGFFIAEPVSRQTIAGLLVCIAGAAILIGFSYSFSPGHVAGDLYGLATSFFFGAYFLAVRAARRKSSGGQVVFASSLVTAAILFIIALALEPGLLPVSASGVFALLALGIVSHAGGQGLLAVALGSLSAAFSSLVIFIEAVAAAGFAWGLLGEALTLQQAAGGGLILAGIWIARPRQA